MTTENINKGLDKLTVPMSGLKLDPKNARKHDQRSVESIAASLKEFGQQKPVVAMSDGTIIAGNGTYSAAKFLGWQKLAVVRFSDLKKARAYALADNRTAELSTWDDLALAKTLDELSAQYDGWTPEMVGFTDAEVMKIIAAASEADVVDNTPPPAATNGSPSAPPAEAAAPSHVRMVQLFLDEKTHPRFLEAVKALAPSYKATTVTDTVLAVVEDMAFKVTGKAHPDSWPLSSANASQSPSS